MNELQLRYLPQELMHTSMGFSMALAERDCQYFPDFALTNHFTAQTGLVTGQTYSYNA